MIIPHGLTVRTISPLGETETRQAHFGASLASVGVAPANLPPEVRTTSPSLGITPLAADILTATFVLTPSSNVTVRPERFKIGRAHV